MYCKNCGSKIKEESKFCSKCGKKVEKEASNKKTLEASIVSEKEIEALDEKVEEENRTKEKEKNKEKETKKEQKETKEKENEETMYCRHCGKQIPEDNIKCPECGYNLKRNQTSSSIDYFELIMVCGCSFLFPIVGLIIWAVTKRDNYKNSKSALVSALVGIGTQILLVFLIVVFVFVFLICEEL